MKDQRGPLDLTQEEKGILETLFSDGFYSIGILFTPASGHRHLFAQGHSSHKPKIVMLQPWQEKTGEAGR